MQYTLSVPGRSGFGITGLQTQQEPDPNDQLNHAEMGGTTFVGGGGGIFTGDPNDGIIYVDRFSTPLLIAWAVNASPHNGVFTGQEPHWTNFDPVYSTAGVVGSGARRQSSFLKVPRWANPAMSPPDDNYPDIANSNLDFPMKIEWGTLMEASGFVMIPVMLGTNGFRPFGSPYPFPDATSKAREDYGIITGFNSFYGTAGDVVDWYAHGFPTSVPRRGVVLQWMHQTGAQDDFFVGGIDHYNIDARPQVANAYTGYPRGGGLSNWRCLWQVRIAYDHPSAQAGLIPLNQGFALEKDWMAMWVSLRPPSVVPPQVRLKQRDDEQGRIRGRPGNNPTSKQRSNRGGHGNTYL